MEIKPGYKLTHVGVIPEEWEVARIGDQSQIFGRIGFRGYTVDDIVEDGAGAVAINPSNIQDGKIVFDKCTYITWRKYEESPEIKIDENDIVLVKTGSTFGKTAMVKKLPGKATLNPQVVVFKKIKPSKVFFGYMIGFPIVQNQITSAVVGGALPTLSQRLVAEFKFPLPPLSEQRAIAQALSDVDDLITALDRLIAKKRDIKQATMQQLLTGKTRLAGFNSTWIKKRFGDISDYVDGEITAGGDDGYIEIGDIDIEKKTYDVSRKAKLSVPGAIKVPAGTLLISTVRPTRGAIAVTSSAIHVSSAFCRLSPKNGLLFYLVSQSTFLAYLGENSFGGTYPTCRDETILGYETMVPADPKEQNAIAAVLSDMDAELLVIEARRDKTRALKQGMMQELLTGRTRLI